MKRCDRFGAFFAAELFLQAAIVIGSFSASFAHAGIVRSQTDTEAVALGDSGQIKIVADWTDTVTLTVEADPCERKYDGEAIDEDDIAVVNNQDSAANESATDDTATNECGDYLCYRYGHLESFYGDGNFAAGELGAGTAEETTAANDNSNATDNERNVALAKKSAAGDEKVGSDDATNDEENIAAEESKASSDDKVATDDAAPVADDDKVADDENVADDKGGEQDETVADIAKLTEEAKSADNEDATNLTASQEEECHRYKYQSIHDRCEVNENQASDKDAEKSTDDGKVAAEETAANKKAVDDADDTPATEDYSAAKTEEAYGRDYQADGDEGQIKAADDSTDDNDGANDNDLNSSGCLAICDAFLSVVNDAAGQASSEIRIYYNVVTRLSSHCSSAK